ncbi:MAG: DUF4252 domain-containing protein [Bryobacteraceae bacterium]
MKIAMIPLLCAAALSVQAMWAQDLHNLVPFEQLQSKAAETVEVNLDGNLLSMARKFLSDSKPEEAEAKKLLGNIKGVYVRSLKFKKEGEYSMADVEKVRANVKGPGWQRIVDVRSQEGKGDNAGVYLKTDGNEIQGILVIAAEPRELTVVNIVGTIQPEQLRKLGGVVGLPGIKEASEAVGKASTTGAGKKKNDD